jgi:hypothetical protein
LNTGSKRLRSIGWLLVGMWGLALYGEFAEYSRLGWRLANLTFSSEPIQVAITGAFMFLGPAAILIAVAAYLDRK